MSSRWRVRKVEDPEWPDFPWAIYPLSTEKNGVHMCKESIFDPFACSCNLYKHWIDAMEEADREARR